MEMISKKDLLQQTGISYGQLYRWKRQRLIPEEWFMKQSSYTGQETFFPKEEMLARVQEILKAKDQYSLEELAKIFAPEQAEVSVNMEQLSQMDEISKELLEDIKGSYRKESYTFFDVVLFVELSKAVRTEALCQRRRELLRHAVSAARGCTQIDIGILVFLSLEDIHVLFAKDCGSVCLDSELKTVYRAQLRQSADLVKLKYQGIWKDWRI